MKGLTGRRGRASALFHRSDGGLVYAGGMRPWVLFVAAVSIAVLGCDERSTPSSPSPGAPALTATARIVFLGSTTRRADLSAAAQACVAGVGPTHIHPSWRAFAGIPLEPSPPDRYQIAFNDVPVNTRVSFRINDQNSCDDNPTGAVTSNVFVNDVRLIQNTTTPGNGDEPGYAFTITQNGTITQ